MSIRWRRKPRSIPSRAARSIAWTACAAAGHCCRMPQQIRIAVEDIALQPRQHVGDLLAIDAHVDHLDASAWPQAKQFDSEPARIGLADRAGARSGSRGGTHRHHPQRAAARQGRRRSGQRLGREQLFRDGRTGRRLRVAFGGRQGRWLDGYASRPAIAIASMRPGGLAGFLPPTFLAAHGRWRTPSPTTRAV